MLSLSVWGPIFLCLLGAGLEKRSELELPWAGVGEGEGGANEAKASERVLQMNSLRVQPG